MDSRRNLKKHVAVAVLLVVGSWAYAVAAYGQPWDGNGVEGDPYQIWTAEDMQAIGADANYLDAHFLLCADIDLGSFDGLEGRPAFNLIGYRIGDFHSKPFSGVFDGNDNKIINFTYRNSKRDLAGLFGLFAGEYAQIRNLRLIDPNVIAGTGDYVGSLVGQAGFHDGAPGSDGTVIGCSAEGGRVQGTRFVGGLIGRAEDVTITNCNVSLCVEGDEYVGGLIGFNDTHGIISNCSSSGNVNGDDYVGGLIGSIRHDFGASSGTISECYSSGNISGYRSIGGLIGLIMGATVENCYATGNVRGYDYVGGLVGSISEGSVIYHSYAASSAHGIIDVGGLVGTDKIGEFGDYGGEYHSSFWNNTVNSTLSGLGPREDPPEIIGESTTNMQTEATFTSAGWDFATPVWKICNGPDYPKLWWEECPELWIEADINIVPSTLNLKSKGKWISCYISLPEGYDVGDIKPNSVFLEGAIGAEWVQINGKVAMARFSRSEVQEIIEVGELEVTVTGALADGTMFSGTDVIRVIDKGGSQRHKRLVGR